MVFVMFLLQKACSGGMQIVILNVLTGWFVVCWALDFIMVRLGYLRVWA